MALEETISGMLEHSTAEALMDGRIQQLLSGQMSQGELREFFRHFIVTHLNSIQILSLLFCLAPRDGSELVKENLLEEMGLEEGGKAHPDMLIDLALGLGLSHQDVLRLSAKADEARRVFASTALPYKTLKDLGLAILLETVAFESFLSRVSDRLADSLMKHYGLSAEAVRWFTLHGEVDIRHAEEGKRVIHRYISFYRFGPAEVEQIARNTFARNVCLNRYFPGDSASGRKAGPSRVDTVEILPLHIPFLRSFDHAKMSRTRSDAVIVRVRGSEGLCGYGEALPRPYVTGEDVDTMVTMLRSTLAPEVLKLNFDSGMAVLDQIQRLTAKWARAQSSASKVVAWNATLCAVELALLDWAFKRAGQSLAEWLVPAREQVVYTGIIDATDPATAQELAARYATAKFTNLKVKVGIGDDLQRMEAVRKAAGEQMDIRVDANGAWDAPHAISALKALQPFGIEAVEQPVSASDWSGMRRIREELRIPVIADESLITLSDAAKLIQEEACDVFNIRVSKCGGLFASKAIAELGLAAGMKVQIGAQVGETSLLSAASRHLAAHLPQVQYVEGAFGTHLLSEDITPEPVMFGYEGRGDLLLGEGLGVVVDDNVLERLATDVIKVRG